MISVNRVNIEDLQIGAVLLVDTEDTCLKMVVDYNVGIIEGRCVHVSNLDENEMEEERGTFMISNITIGEPVNGAVYPRQRDDGVVEVGGMLKTAAVTTIEVYQDEEHA